MSVTEAPSERGAEVGQGFSTPWARGLWLHTIQAAHRLEQNWHAEREHKMQQRYSEGSVETKKGAMWLNAKDLETWKLKILAVT